MGWRGSCKYILLERLPDCIIAQNESTGLWTLFNGDIIVDNTCTEIIFDSKTFQLIHGGESKTYSPIDRG